MIGEMKQHCFRIDEATSSGGTIRWKKSRRDYWPSMAVALVESNRGEVHVKLAVLRRRS
jgi:hypothetical protein